MEQYSIRCAASKDAAGMLDCLRLAFEPFRELYTHAAYEDTVLMPETMSLRLASMQAYVAVTDSDRVIGTIACSVVSKEKGHLRGMAVVPEWQGRGLAGALLKTAETALIEKGCSLVTLDTTEPLERAISFYKRNGFSATGKVTHYFGMPLYQYAKTLVR